MVSNKLSWNVLATCSCACVKTSSHCDSTSSNAFWTQMALDSSRLQREVPYETSSGFRNPNGAKCISLCFRFVQLWGCLMGECLKNNPSSLYFWDDADHAFYDTHLHFDSKDEIHRFQTLNTSQSRWLDNNSFIHFISCTTWYLRELLNLFLRDNLRFSSRCSRKGMFAEGEHLKSSQLCLLQTLQRSKQ